MPNKKTKKAEEPDVNQELVQRIDAMMSTEPKAAAAKTAPAVSKASSKTASKKPDPETQKTAPKLPPKLLKNVEATTKPKTSAKPPIVISLADEGETSPDPEPTAEAEPGQTETDVEAVGSDTPEETQDPDPDPTQPDDPLEDSATDQAVDDIVAREGDTILAVNDALVAREQAEAEPGYPSGPRRKHKWLWFIGLVVVLGTAIDLFLLLSG